MEKNNAELKLDLIKAAYGINYERLKKNINCQDGFVYVKVIARLTTDKTEPEHFQFDIRDFDYDFEIKDLDTSFKWRPKILVGIENNSGWIRIEHDGSNLPRSKDPRHFMPCEDGKPRPDYQMTADGIIDGFLAGYISHYKKIEPIKKPNY